MLICGSALRMIPGLANSLTHQLASDISHMSPQWHFVYQPILRSSDWFHSRVGHLGRGPELRICLSPCQPSVLSFGTPISLLCAGQVNLHSHDLQRIIVLDRSVTDLDTSENRNGQGLPLNVACSDAIAIGSLLRPLVVTVHCIAVRACLCMQVQSSVHWLKVELGDEDYRCQVATVEHNTGV